VEKELLALPILVVIHKMKEVAVVVDISEAAAVVTMAAAVVAQVISHF
jgi:hypothetical protein